MSSAIFRSGYNVRAWAPSNQWAGKVFNGRVLKKLNSDQPKNIHSIASNLSYIPPIEVYAPAWYATAGAISSQAGAKDAKLAGLAAALAFAASAAMNYGYSNQIQSLRNEMYKQQPKKQAPEPSIISEEKMVSPIAPELAKETN